MAQRTGHAAARRRREHVRRTRRSAPAAARRSRTQLDVPLLGTVPLDPALREAGDRASRSSRRTRTPRRRARSSRSPSSSARLAGRDPQPLAPLVLKRRGARRRPSGASRRARCFLRTCFSARRRRSARRSSRPVALCVRSLGLSLAIVHAAKAAVLRLHRDRGRRERVDLAGDGQVHARPRVGSRQSCGCRAAPRSPGARSDLPPVKPPSSTRAPEAAAGFLRGAGLAGRQLDLAVRVDRLKCGARAVVTHDLQVPVHRAGLLVVL